MTNPFADITLPEVPKELAYWGLPGKQAMRKLTNNLGDIADSLDVLSRYAGRESALTEFVSDETNSSDPAVADYNAELESIGEEESEAEEAKAAEIKAIEEKYAALTEQFEARKDTVVIIHPLTDHRRRLPIEKRGTILDAPPDFMLVVSYNPGYQSILKDLKQSTRQRFVAIDFDYPPAEMETEIVAREGGVDEGTARDLVLIGQKVRNLRGHGLEEGVSTRLLIYAAQLINLGIPPVTAAETAMCAPITDDRELQRSIREIITTVI